MIFLAITKKEAELLFLVIAEKIIRLGVDKLLPTVYSNTSKNY